MEKAEFFFIGFHDITVLKAFYPGRNNVLESETETREGLKEQSIRQQQNLSIGC